MSNVDGLEAKIVAVLHDMLEDTEMTEEGLRAEGFSDTVVDAVVVLTRPKTESRKEAARRAVKNPIARAVKLADVAHNMLPERIEEPTPNDTIRFQEYTEVLKILRGEIE